MNEWDNEPDRLEFDHVGFKCLVLRPSEMKHLCGYVGLPKWHPYYGKHYNQCLLGCSGEVSDFPPLKKRGIRQWKCTFDERDHPNLEMIIRVHGGLTFSQQGDGETWDKDLWWLGFDCAHSGDLVPGMYEKYGVVLPERFTQLQHDEVYRNIDYIKNETMRLAEQLTATAIAERAFGNG